MLQLLSAQQNLRPFVMQNSVVLMIKQNNSLPDILENAGLHFVQHGMCGIIEAIPVNQKRHQAVAADGIIQQ